MSKLARRESQEFGSIVFAFSLALALEVWLKTKNWTLALLTFFGPLVLILTVKGIRWHLRKKALLESSIDVIDHMSGTAFEELLLVHFQAQGYAGTLTQETGDYGADLVLEKAGTRVVVQAKRWKNVVGVAAVQEITAAMKYYGAEKGMVVTNSVFTGNAYQLAQANGIELVDREKLIEMMRKSQGPRIKERQSPENAEFQQLRDQENNGILPEKLCPRCGKVLVARSGKFDRFIGCSGFPDCRFTQQG
jgi:restriction system protein